MNVLGRAVEALKEVDGQMFICADHGNAEQLIDYETGEPWTAHTTNPVPFILVNADPKYTLRENGCLADIIPTLIQLMGMEQPAEMTGESLLVERIITISKINRTLNKPLSLKIQGFVTIMLQPSEKEYKKAIN